MKRTLTTIILISLSFLVFGQVGGISASKLATLCVEPVPHKSIEFEPVFGFSATKGGWDENGKYQIYFESKDSIATNAGLGFRFSYGAFKNFEIGAAMPVSTDVIYWGMKYKLPFESKFQLGLLAGLNTPFGNSIYGKSIDESVAYAGGLVGTVNFSERFSWDFDVQFQKFIYTGTVAHNSDFFANTDFGYFLSDGFQFVLGANFGSMYFSEKTANSRFFAINPGITIESAENFILVLNSPYNIYGVSVEKSFGLGVSLTIVID